jgi:hypothetical protein
LTFPPDLYAEPGSPADILLYGDVATKKAAKRRSSVMIPNMAFLEVPDTVNSLLFRPRS